MQNLPIHNHLDSQDLRALEASDYHKYLQAYVESHAQHQCKYYFHIIVAVIILFNPTRIQIPLLQALWAFIQSIWKAICLDFLGSSQTFQKACLLHSPSGDAL